MVIGYVDTSWLLHVRLDPAVQGFLRGAAPAVDVFVSSEVSVVEVGRVLRRTGAPGDLGARVALLMSGLDLLAIDQTTIAVARDLPTPFVKSLDAIHLASAVTTGVDVLLTRDRQMARAGESLGLPVA